MSPRKPKEYDDEDKRQEYGPWSDRTLIATIARRKELDGAVARAVDLGLELDRLEEQFGISSAVAMLRIKAGTLQMPAWERMHEEYVGLIRKRP